MAYFYHIDILFADGHHEEIDGQLLTLAGPIKGAQEKFKQIREDLHAKVLSGEVVDYHITYES